MTFSEITDLLVAEFSTEVILQTNTVNPQPFLVVDSARIAEVCRFLRDDDRLFVLHRGVTLAVRDLTLAAPVSAAASGGDGKVRAAMNGRVVAVLVKPGDQVTAGQPVMTLEAMKMEHVHKAGIDGVVAAIDVAEGEQVTTGRIVAEIGVG